MHLKMFDLFKNSHIGRVRWKQAELGQWYVYVCTCDFLST
jgi:hypothetical protein